MSINVAIEVHPLLDSDWFKIGGSHDVDTVIRAAGFDNGDEIAKLIIKAEGYDPISVSVITLGEHRVNGLPGTDREDEDVSDDMEYIQKHLEALHENGCIREGCWLSVDMGMSLEDEDNYFRMSDEYVTSGIGYVLKGLPELLQGAGYDAGFDACHDAGFDAIGEQLEEAYKAHGENAYLEVFTQSNCLIAPDVLGDRFLDSLADISTPDTSSDMNH